jgi:hypothetical protein
MGAFIRNATLAVLYLLAIADLLTWINSFVTDMGPRPIPDILRAIYFLTFVTAIGLAALIVLVGKK